MGAQKGNPNAQPGEAREPFLEAATIPDCRALSCFLAFCKPLYCNPPSCDPVICSQMPRGKPV